MKTKVNSIPQPTENMHGIFTTVIAIKEVVETLTGQVGPVNHRSPTWQELVDIGLIKADQIPFLHN